MRRRVGVRRPLSSKPNACTERHDVDPTRISGKVARITRGDLSSCLVLPASRGAGMGWQKSAADIVGSSTLPKVQTCNTDRNLAFR
jgi:hypothetical protein